MGIKTIKVKYIGVGRVVIECPNCGRDVDVRRRVHYKCESFTGECWRCGWRFQIKDYEYDWVQPDSPFFELIYKFHPEKEAEKRRKEKEFAEEQRKMRLEEKYDRDPRMKSWDRKTIKRIVLEER